MDKEYMLRKISARLETLRKRYVIYLTDHDEKGREVSVGYGKQLRTKTKRDICILTLIQYLLITSSSVYIEDDDAIMGFDKLIGE